MHLSLFNPWEVALITQWAFPSQEKESHKLKWKQIYWQLILILIIVGRGLKDHRVPPSARTMCGGFAPHRIWHLPPKGVNNQTCTEPGRWMKLLVTELVLQTKYRRKWNTEGNKHIHRHTIAQTPLDKAQRLLPANKYYLFSIPASVLTLTQTEWGGQAKQSQERKTGKEARGAKNKLCFRLYRHSADQWNGIKIPFVFSSAHFGGVYIPGLPNSLEIFYLQLRH